MLKPIALNTLGAVHALDEVRRRPNPGLARRPNPRPGAPTEPKLWRADRSQQPLRETNPLVIWNDYADRSGRLASPDDFPKRTRRRPSRAGFPKRTRR